MKSTIPFYTVLVTLFTRVEFSDLCGPGSKTSRDKARKPMVLYQRLPDVDEESISGSGMFRKIVTRESDSFKTFVSNRNKDIVFDGNRISSRLMTQRCSEKLNKLAVLVKREWPRVKLRVIGAYDEHGQHPPNSLHYEGRAVDISTSDRDRSKTGVLGVLAFRAGFDWVFYESKSFIHASVIADNEVSLKYAECFPASSRVTTKQRGQITMDKLHVGDQVLTYRFVDRKWSPIYTEVLGFLDRKIDVERQFIKLNTANGMAVEATKSHLLFAFNAPNKRQHAIQSTSTLESNSDYHVYSTHSNEQLVTADATKKLLVRNNITDRHCHSNIDSNKFIYELFTSGFPTPPVGIRSNKVSMEKTRVLENNISPVYVSGIKKTIRLRMPSLSVRNKRTIVTLFADAVKNGTSLMAITNNTGLQPSEVIYLSSVWRLGAYAPLTNEGTLIVDGILVSCYAKVNDQETVHSVFVVFRFIASYFPMHSREKILNWYVNVLITINDLFNFVKLY